MLAGLASIVGQDRAVAQLSRALASGSAHHAYLFEGPDGVGKRATARAFAQAANCLSPTRNGAGEGDACGACESCRKIAADLHPDVKWFAVFNEEGKEKGQADRVKDLIGTLGFPPHEGRARIVVLEPADELNEPSCNKLLKTLEEPPPRTHFILVTARAASLLVTIRSRCQRVSFGALPDAEVATLIAQLHNCTPAQAEEAAALAQGSPGRALQLVSTDDLQRRRRVVRQLLEAARAKKATGVLDAAGELGGDREEAAALLELMFVAYHDAVLVAGGVAEGRLSSARLDEARWLAGGRSTVELLRGLRSIAEAVEAIDGNVGPSLTFEALLLALGQKNAA